MTEGQPETPATTIFGASTLTGAAASEIIVLEAVAGEALVIPHGTMLLTADFARQGSDLLLTSPDGDQVLISGYFELADPPALATAGGAELAPELMARLAGPLAPGQYAQTGPAADSEPIGIATVVDGTVTATRTDGTKVTLEIDTPIYLGDVMETGPDSSVGLVFIDNTTFSLGAGARMVIDDLIYDPETGVGAMSISVLQGVFFFVTGEIAASGPDAMVVTTPVSVIGIRGTKVAGRAAQEGEENIVTLLAEDDGGVGVIVVSTDIGQIILDSSNYLDNAVIVSSARAVPQLDSFSPSQFDNTFGDTVRVHQSTVRVMQERRQQEGDQQDGDGQQGDEIGRAHV